jgi:hypothetical protein
MSNKDRIERLEDLALDHGTRIKRLEALADATKPLYRAPTAEELAAYNNPTPEPVASPQPTVVDWQPIETVPWETPILAVNDDGEISTEFLLQHKPRWHTHWAPLPAPPTEPAPEPSPDKAERYTVTDAGQGDTHYVEDGVTGTIGIIHTRADAELIAAALNFTPDPLLVGLVDACRALLDAIEDSPNEQPKQVRALMIDVASSLAYLAEQEGE